MPAVVLAGPHRASVVEVEGRLLPIEVKATGAGLLLHTGAQLEWIAPDVLAAPWWAVC